MKTKKAGYVSAKMRTYRMRLKARTIQAYGGRCECCGEKRLGFLTIDHTSGGGGKQRAANPSGGGKFYRRLRDAGYPRGHRVLCFNCNFGAWLGKGTCIHKLDGGHARMSSAQFLRAEERR